jgi:hypothetical protein
MAAQTMWPAVFAVIPKKANSRTPENPSGIIGNDTGVPVAFKRPAAKHKNFVA